MFDLDELKETCDGCARHGHLSWCRACADKAEAKFHRLSMAVVTLKVLQWSHYDPALHEPACPICYRLKRNGHRESCTIAAVLREVEP